MNTRYLQDDSQNRYREMIPDETAPEIKIKWMWWWPFPYLIFENGKLYGISTPDKPKWHGKSGSVNGYYYVDNLENLWVNMTHKIVPPDLEKKLWKRRRDGRHALFANPWRDK